MGGPYPPSHETFWLHGYVTIEKRYTLTFKLPIAPKVGRVVTQVKWTPPTKPCDHVVAWKIENFISTLPQNLWQPNLAGWWLRVENLVPPLLAVILMHCKKFCFKKLILQVQLLPHLLLHFWMSICTTSIIYGAVFLVIPIEPLIEENNVVQSQFVINVLFYNNCGIL